MDESALQAPTAEPVDPDLLFRALADPTRRFLLRLLAEDELSVSEIVQVLKQPQSTVSRHLRVLRRAGLLRDRRDGTAVLYVAAGAPRSSAEAGHASDLATPTPHGDDGRLPDLLLGWLAHRPLPPRIEARLRRVLERRRSDTSRFFNRLGNRWDELRTAAFGSAFVTEAFLSLLPRGWTVADIGTGTGSLLPLLSDHFAQVIAVDPAETMLECAGRRVQEHGATNVDLRRGDLARLPIEPATTDLAIAVLVIHHVRRPAEALAQMHAILRPGGRVLIVEQEAHENQAFYERMQDLWWGFDPDPLGRLLADAGFLRVRHQRLSTAGDAGGAPDSPALFVLTGERADVRQPA